MLPFFVSILSFVAYLLLLQQHPYGDGILYLEFARKGVLAGSHLLYMPGLVGFTRFFEGGGLGDRQLAFIYSALMAALGNGFLFATLRRYCRRIRPALVSLVLVAFAPSTLFFATTVEVHGQHYGLVCAALYFFCRLIDRESPRPWAYGLAGAIVLLAPLSHETGWILLAFFLPMAVTRFGRESLLQDIPAKLPRALAFLLAPALLWFFNQALRTWLFVDVFQVPGAPTGNPSSMELYNKVLHPANTPEGWLPFLWKGFFRPAWAVWLSLGISLPLLAKQSFVRFFSVGAAFLAYLVLLTLYGYPEKGAYFLGFLPLAALSLSMVLPKFQGLLSLFTFLAAISAVDAISFTLRYPHENSYPLWTWARDIEGIRTKELEGKKPTVLAKGMFEAATLRYDYGIPAEPAGDTLRNLARSLLSFEPEEQKSKKVLIGAQILLHLRQLQRKGPILLSEDFAQALQTHFPNTWAKLQASKGLHMIRGGNLKVYVIL